MMSSVHSNHIMGTALYLQMLHGKIPGKTGQHANEVIQEECLEFRTYRTTEFHRLQLGSP